MTFGKKLSFLIKNFNISNSKLAKAISVDPSLVSKWINGRRVPPANSPYIIHIAEHFLKHPSDEYQQAGLLELLRAEFPHLDLEIYGTRKKALIKWLTGLNIPFQEHFKAIHMETIPGNSWPTIPYISRFFPDHSQENGQASGELSFFELFRGREGRRNSVINFLQSVLNANEPIELWLASQEDIIWIIEDKEILSQWKMMLKEILSRGHTIKIIHTVHRDISQISAMINHWVPLHLNGKVESFYHPKYEEPFFFKTIFIARGITSIFSFSTSLENDSAYTFQFRDSVVLDLLEQGFRSYLTQCQPLTRTFSGDKILQIFTEIIDIHRKPGYLYTLRDSLISLTMPLGLYARLIGRSSLTGKAKEERIQLHQLWTEAFLHTIKHNRFREICPIEAINLLLSENTYMYPGSDFFLVEPFRLEAEDLLEHLSNIIFLLENNVNYELILFNNRPPLMPSNISLTFKEDYYAIISSFGSAPPKPYALVTSEGNTLQAFENYFENIYGQVPVNNRNKAWIIKKLSTRVSQLLDIINKS